MKNIRIADVTLRENGESSNAPFSFKEKLEIAKQLDRLAVDVIELAPIKDEKTDILFIHTLSMLLKNSVISCPAGFSTGEADKAWSAVSTAKKARLSVSLPVSAVQMEYLCKKKPKAMLELIGTLVSHCASLCRDVEFAAVDAARSEREFLAAAVKTAIDSGATTVTLCDTSGTLLPTEMGEFIEDIKSRVPDLASVTLAVRCDNGMNMAAASSISAVLLGAAELKVSVIGATAPATEAIAHAIRLRGDSIGITARLKTTELKMVLSMLRPITDTKKSDSSPFDSGVAEGEKPADILDAAATPAAVNRVVKKLGYTLSDEDKGNVYEAFKRIARKKAVGAAEIEAIVASAALQVPPTYILKSYVINSGNIITPTAHITLEKDGADISGLSAGDGPIDASFLAIEQVTGHHYELDDFQIQAVTEGREAMGDALVKLRYSGKLYSGKGISTDILGASIRAYINALNKIVYEEIK